MASGIAASATGGRISLRGITARGRHGVYDFERQDGQDFVVDVTCELDLDPAARGDDLSLTLDYARLARAIAEDIEGPPLNLIEALAARIAATCLRAERVQSVEVTVHKPQAPMPVAVTDVAVTLVRTRSCPPVDDRANGERSR